MIMQNTLYTNDNLFVLNGMNSESVDLIYLDPPFNSKRTYSAPVGTKSAGASFKDMWSWQDVDEAYLEKLAQDYPSLVEFIKSIQHNNSKAMMAYVTYVTQRLIEMHRILKETGLLYLHCDPTASHYLKIVLDKIFGRNNFRNEITWERTTDTGSSKAIAKFFPRNNDIILFYSKSDQYYFNKIYNDYSESYIKNKFNEIDEIGKYRWQVLKTYSDETLKKLKLENKVKITENSKYYYYKQYLSESKGVRASSLWKNDDITPLGPNSSESTGYPTQKPLALLERIIQASSQEGDVVFDPFCGCATTCVAAQRLGRKWIGIDIEEKAAEVLIERLSDDAGLFKDFTYINVFKNPNLNPQRTDVERIATTEKSVKERLFQQQNGHCNGCNINLDIWHFEVDHVVAKAKGGGDYFENYQLLCGSCNKIKGARPMEYLRLKIRTRRDLMEKEIEFGE